MFSANGRRNKSPLKGLSLRDVLSRIAPVEDPSGQSASSTGSLGPNGEPHAKTGTDYNAPADGRHNPVQMAPAVDSYVQPNGQQFFQRDDRGFNQIPFGADQAGSDAAADRANRKQFADEVQSRLAGRRNGTDYPPLNTEFHGQYQRPTTHQYPASSLFDPGFPKAHTDAPEELAAPPPLRSANLGRTIMFAGLLGGIALAISGAFIVSRFGLLPASLKGATTFKEEVGIDRTPDGTQRTPSRALANVAASMTSDGSQPANLTGGSMPVTSQSSGITMVPVLSIAPLPTQPTARLRIPDVIAASAAQDISFPIELDSPTGSTANLKVVITGLPSTGSLSQGTRAANGTWTIDAAKLVDLKVTMPDGASREQLTVVLATNGGVQLARLSPVIEIRPESDFKASLGKNDNEDKASVLLEHGKARIADGDVIGARMFFKKGADTGDARAAMAMGATFDPNLFASLQVQGMVPDVKAARQWYERAINLGSKDAQDRLERLNSR